ncbi:hypothetical protein PVAG01_08308 [Phlyctema vagabunda]|uniref:Alginate lyase domain-containing protein n=1 Tax=Phlyctema vagabunda TaxID=108571 RepID=A0ABR4P935_9HELO
MPPLAPAAENLTLFTLWLLVLSLATLSTSSVVEIPSVYGPVYPVTLNPAVDTTKYFKSKPGDFVHPGLWHTHEDLERIRSNSLGGVEPWASAYAVFKTDSYSLASYTMQGPKAVLARGKTSNYTTFTNDVRAAWQNALMWYITKEQDHWDRSTTILDAWGSNLTDIIGTDRSLLVGLEGDLFANAAEIMRWEGNWTETGSSWRGGSGFSNQLYWLFRGQSVVIGQANYGMVSIKALLSFAVYLDDVSVYNYAMNEFINNQCAGLLATYEPTTGQSVESGRDQSHTQSALAWAAYGARVAQSQGADLYGLGDNLLLKGAEYTAAFNLNQTVPFDPKWYRCEAILVGGPWPEIAYNAFGISNSTPVWDILYYQYAVHRQLEAPWTVKAKKAEGFEGPVTKNDHPSWGDLIWAY